MTEQMREVIAFLLGEGPLDGCWFGEKPAHERGNFWWRKHLRAALSHGEQGEAWTRVSRWSEVPAFSVRLLEETAHIYRPVYGEDESIVGYEYRPINTAPTVPAGWQPIETAPKDGAHVLIADASKMVPTTVTVEAATIADAVKHLTAWLDMNDCECESGHRCGRTEVQRTRDKLRALASQPAEQAEPQCSQCGTVGRDDGRTYTCSECQPQAVEEAARVSDADIDIAMMKTLKAGNFPVLFNKVPVGADLRPFVREFIRALRNAGKEGV